jgi:Polyketide cyclase / dehydrase and lipid transport
MKYADGPTVTVEVSVSAQVDAVWKLVIDINLPARFSDEFRGAMWLDDGPAFGARFVGTNWHEALGEWQTTSIVDRYDPPRSFGWRVGDMENPSSSWWFELEERPLGTRLVQGARMGPAPSGLSIAIAAMPEKEERIVGRRMSEFQANMAATLDGIKRLAESSR